MNTKIRDLEDRIVALLNDSDVPIEAKKLIVADVYHIVSREADKVIMFEVKALQKEETNDGGLREN